MKESKISRVSTKTTKDSDAKMYGLFIVAPSLFQSQVAKSIRNEGRAGTCNDGGGINFFGEDGFVRLANALGVCVDAARYRRASNNDSNGSNDSNKNENEIEAESKVSERSDRAFWKTRILEIATDITAASTTKLTHPIRLTHFTRFARPSLKMRLASLRFAGRRQKNKNKKSLMSRKNNSMQTRQRLTTRTAQ